MADANETLTETHRAIKRIRDIRKQVDDIINRASTYEETDDLEASGNAMLDKMKSIEETLYQTKNQSRQDPLNFPIRLNNKLAAVKGTVQQGEYRPTDQQIAVKNELTAKIEAELEKLEALLEQELPAFNDMVRDLQLPAVFVEQQKKPAM